MKHFSEISSTAERVVDAAEGLIQLRGYNGFSYDDVAKLVGIKKPSIHHHFATKGELAAVVAQRYAFRFGEQLLLLDVRYSDVADRLAAYAALFQQTYATDQRLCLCAMLGAESNTIPDCVTREIRHFFAANVAWLTKAISEGQRTGQIRAESAAADLAQAFLCTLEGAMVVSRSMGSTAGPAPVGNTFLLSVMAA